MNGDLAEGVVPGLLREIYVGRRDGTLTFVRGGERQSLRFRRGHIVNAHTNVQEERLGEMLVRRGLLSEAVQAVRDPDVVRYGLGDMDRVLVLSSDPLVHFQKLTLSPADGFVPSRVDGATSAREIVQMIPLPAEQAQKSLLGLLSTGVVEYGGVRRPHDASAPAHPAPEPPPVAPPPSGPPPAGPGLLDDKAAERRREILEAWEGLKTRNYFEVLGLSRSFGEAEVKEAYFRLAKRFHPDVHHGASLGNLRDELEAVFIRLGEAYEVLRDPRKRGDYEERLGRQRSKPGAPAGSAAPSPPEPPAPEPPRNPEDEARLAEGSIRRAAKLFEQEKCCSPRPARARRPWTPGPCSASSTPRRACAPAR